LLTDRIRIMIPSPAAAQLKFSRKLFGRIGGLRPSMLCGLTVLMAWLYRSRWPLYLEPWLALVGVTLTFIGYGAGLFGAPLSVGAYGLVWAGLGLLHLGGAAVLDRSERRYGHGLYLGGYAQLLLAIGWTLFDRPLLLWTLLRRPTLLPLAITLAITGHHCRKICEKDLLL